jgi:hypothetical protein
MWRPKLAEEPIDEEIEQLFDDSFQAHKNETTPSDQDTSTTKLPSTQDTNTNKNSLKNQLKQDL